MSKRLYAYIKQQPVGFHQLIDDAKKLKIYLIDELEKFIFEFKTQNGQKFKIQIGQKLLCTLCNIKEQCIHTVFVLLKIFKRDIVKQNNLKNNDPLLWQRSYTQQDLSELQIQRQQYLPKKKNEIIILTQQNPEIRHQINEDKICPICHEEFNINSPITYCKANCGNNFHNYCLMNWCEKQKETKNGVSCPICRVEFEKNIQTVLEIEEEEFDQKFLFHSNYNCITCNNKKPIYGSVYKCIFCEEFHLCENCYCTRKHEHDAYLIKQKTTSEWVPVFKNQDQMLIKCDLIRDVFKNSSLAQNEMVKFLIQRFPNPYNHKQNKIQKLKESIFKNNLIQINKIDPITIKYDCNYQRLSCCKCGREQHKLKKLLCGHIIDVQCLEKILSSDDLQNLCKCPSCNKIVCLGYYGIAKKLINKNMERFQHQQQVTDISIIQQKQLDLRENHLLSPIKQNFIQKDIGNFVVRGYKKK